MNRGINLLPNQSKDLLAQKKILSILRITAVGMLAFVGISAVIVFFLRIQSPLPTLQSEQDRVLSLLSHMQIKSGKFVFINQWLTYINDIVTKRPNFDVVVDQISTNASSDITIYSLSIESKKVSIAASSQSLTSINQFLDNLVGLANNKKLFRKITLDDISYDKRNQGYFFSVEGDLL